MSVYYSKLAWSLSAEMIILSSCSSLPNLDKGIADLLWEWHWDWELTVCSTKAGIDGWLSEATLRPLFTKFLILRLTFELDNLRNDWLESAGPINHPAGYLIHELTPELKFWWVRP